MAIDYVEIRDESTTLLGIIDTAQSIIWRSVYFGVGDFEIYVPASQKVVALLQAGNFVTRPDNAEVGIIEKINIAYNEQDGRMVTATGRFAKSILERRLIYNFSNKTNRPTILTGSVEEAARQLVYDNAIYYDFDLRRNIPLLALGDSAGLPQIISDSGGNATQKQVSYANLLTYTDELLQEFGLAATVILDEDAGKLRYVVFAGTDRSWDNKAGNDPVLFSKDFDGFVSSSYEYDTTTEKNFALIGGAGEDLERFFSIVADWQQGMQRREMMVEATSLNRTYKDDNDVEQTYTDAEYRAMLNATGKQQLNARNAEEHFHVVLDIQNSRWKYKRDFELGDIVTAQDDDIGKYVNVRVLEVLEVQDENGYTIEANTQS